MRGVLVAALIVLAGCAGSGAPTADPEQPIYSGGSTKDGPVDAVVVGDPWGNLSRMVVLEGRVNWHDDPNAFSAAYDRATQPVAHPCSWDGGVYFNNVWLGAASIWNFTQRVEVVLEWDPLSYTRDRLRVAYDTGDGFADSTPGASGQPIVVPVTPEMWDLDPRRPGSFGGNIGFAACPDEDTGSLGVPPYFEGELRYRVTAFK